MERHKHESVYGNSITEQLETTTVHYGSGTLEGGSSTEYFFLYLEAPLYAKNLIWDENEGNTTAPFTVLTPLDLAPYLGHYGNHHDVNKFKMNFKTATGSEKVEINDANGSAVFAANFAGDADSDFGLVGYKDSYDYVIDNNLCDDSLCLERNRTMAFEFQFTKNTTDNDALIGNITNGLEFHLSPERRTTIVPSTIPVRQPCRFSSRPCWASELWDGGDGKRRRKRARKAKG